MSHLRVGGDVVENGLKGRDDRGRDSLHRFSAAHMEGECSERRHTTLQVFLPTAQVKQRVPEPRIRRRRGVSGAATKQGRYDIPVWSAHQCEASPLRREMQGGHHSFAARSSPRTGSLPDLADRTDMWTPFEVIVTAGHWRRVSDVRETRRRGGNVQKTKRLRPENRTTEKGSLHQLVKASTQRQPTEGPKPRTEDERAGGRGREVTSRYTKVSGNKRYTVATMQ